MRRRVIWSRPALDDLIAAASHVARDRPAAARVIAASIRECAKRLGVMATGRFGRVAGTYEKLVPRLPYGLAYEFRRQEKEETLVILHVIHTSRDWPEGEWPE